LTRIAVFAAKTPHARGVCAGPVKAAAVALAGNATRSTHGRTDKTNLARNWTMLKRKRQNDTTSLILLILLAFSPLTLASRLEKTHNYDLQLEGLFPERADLHLEFSNKHELVNLEDSIRRDRVFFEVPEGVSRAYLHVEESYSSTIVVASLDPFFDSDHDKTVRRSLYHRTVKVTVKMINAHHHRVPNVTLNYAIGFPFFDQNAMEASLEEAEVVFHLPEQTFVYIKPEVHGRAQPHSDNPAYFRAKDGLEVFLVFSSAGTESQTSSLRMNVALDGEGFDVPEGTFFRYVTKDDAGDPVDQGIAATNDQGKAIIDITVDTAAYIDFAIGGSDGFEPVFFQPFDYVYNISTSSNSDDSSKDHDVIQIPVKSWKNVIVSVKDCFTGEMIDTRALVKFPEDAASPHSWYDRHLMPNRYSAFADDQGMAFFQLEPDVMVPIEVTASGYESYHSRIGIASNVTHLVAADLCKKFTVELKVIDPKHGNVAGHATVSVSIDGGKAFDITTNSRGKASFHATTAMRSLTLQLTDADDSIENPTFELHDAMDFLREVDLDILERMYTTEIATASCQDFRHYPEVPVLVQITYKNDDNDNGIHLRPPQGYKTWTSGHDHRQHLNEFVLTSDHHGYLRLRLHESATNVTLTVLQPPKTEATSTSASADHLNLGLMPSRDLPDRFQFLFRALPKIIEVNVKDAQSHRRLTGAPVAVTYYDHETDGHRTLNSITDGEGRAFVELDGCVEFASFVVSSPKDDCHDYHEEKRHHWNILDQHKFTIALKQK